MHTKCIRRQSNFEKSQLVYTCCKYENLTLLAIHHYYVYIHAFNTLICTNVFIKPLDINLHNEHW